MFGRWCLLAALMMALGLGCTQEKPKHKSSSQVLLPSAVMAGFESAHPNATIRRVEKGKLANGRARWDIEYVTAEGKKARQSFDSAGNPVEQR